jgi:hypothetical protein
MTKNIQQRALVLHNAISQGILDVKEIQSVLAAVGSYDPAARKGRRNRMQEQLLKLKTQPRKKTQPACI